MESAYSILELIWHYLSTVIPQLVRDAIAGILSGNPAPQDVLVAVSAATSIVLVLLAVIVVVRSTRQPEPTTSLAKMTRVPRLLGYVVVCVFLGGFAYWAAYAPLSSAAMAVGVVSPDGSRKTVQHLEGGIVSEILVREGDRVDAGDVLVTLETSARLRVLKRHATSWCSSAQLRRGCSQRKPDWMPSRFPRTSPVTSAVRHSWYC